MSQKYLLEMRGICKSFPGVKALQNVELQLESGEVHALLGENGAGKSTLIKVLGGIYHAEEGEIYIDGDKVNIDGVPAARKAGIAIVHQELVLVPYMTVAENIFLGRELGGKLNTNISAMEKETQALLDEFNLGIRADQKVASLSIAQQQMVEIAKAISANSRILVLDEPTSSISDKEVDFLFRTMKGLTAKGVGIIYISHKMSELFDICDRVTVMRDGQTVGTKVVAETNKDELVALMVGRELTNYYTRDYLPQGEEILRVEHISDGKLCKDASFELHKNEIIGFAGLVGSGRSEAMKALFGLTPGSTGDVYVGGTKVVIKTPIDALKYNIALVPESRKTEGLYGVQSVRFNTTIEVLKEFLSKGHLNAAKEEEITERFIKMMNTKTPSHEQTIQNLSGGNQQKVLIGRWLATSPTILILDEPTRGVDVGAKAEIYSIMNELVKEGLAIIMISSELPEILNMSDRIYVMQEGKVVGCLGHEEATQERIMQLAAR
ncbi:MAG: sugar ABC transporter ATP-binding protein [Blautia sp.]|nr:sugar ABC transporter ATP-binding protein [Blautia sp.]